MAPRRAGRLAIAGFVHSSFRIHGFAEKNRQKELAGRHPARLRMTGAQSRN
jgi:hypothetical protein